MPDPADAVRVIANRGRIAVLGRLAIAPGSAEEVAVAVSVSIAEARRILGRLARAGLITADAGVYTLDEAALRRLAPARPHAGPPAPYLLANLSADQATVIGRYFRGRHLTELPPPGARRLTVLKVLADEFEPGRYYTEADVRRILRRFHPDDAALRRFLVEEGLLLRDPAGRTYWRGGGPGPDGLEIPVPLRD